MSWLYSQALVEEYSEESYLDGEPFAQLNVMPTQHRFWRNDKTMGFCRLSQFGLTLRVLTEQDGEELLMSYLEGFHAKTSAAQEKEPELMAKKADNGEISKGSFARYNPISHTLKTAQFCLLGDSKECSVILPKSGLMQDGELYQLQNLALPTKGIGCGLWLPTPTAHNAKEGNYPAERTRKTPTLAAVLGGKINPEFVEWMMGWPIGWTDLKPLAMDKFQEWQQQHGKY